MKMKFTDCIDIVGNTCKYFEGSKWYISTGALDEDHINESEVEIIEYETKPSRANLLVEYGDVLFAKMQATKKTLMVNEKMSDYVYSTGFYAIHAKRNLITPRCLFYILTSDSFLRQKDLNCSGATQKAITNIGLNKIVVNIPPFDKQEMIVAKLDKLNTIIEKRQKQLKYFDELIKARFVEMFGDPEINSMNWNKKTMGEYMSLLTDFSSNGSYEYLDSNVKMYDEPNYALMIRTTDLESNDFENGVKYIDENAYNILSKSKVYGNEIIMNKIGSAGKVYLMPVLNRPVSLGRNAFMFRFNSDINVKFLYYLLISEYGEREIQQHVRGAVTKTITKDATRSVRIIIPPLSLQNKFADFVQQVDKSKFINQR